MDWLDDEGRLFGAVNVVDALVVVGIVAVVATGVLLFLGSPDGPGVNPAESTNFGTVEFNISVPGGNGIPEVGDALVPENGGDGFQVRDTYLSYARDGDVHVTARVSYNGTAEVGSTAVTLGSTYQLQTPGGREQVRFISRNDSSAELDTRQLGVVLAVPRSQQVSQAIEAGDTAAIGTPPAAQIESIRRFDNGTDSMAEVVGIQLNVLRREDTNWFGGEAVRVNQRLTVVTDDAIVTGTIYRVETTDTVSIEAPSDD